MFILRDLLQPLQAHFFRYRFGPGAILIICLHATGCYRPVHIVHNVQFTAFPGNLVRHWHQKEALLHVYGLLDIALAKALHSVWGLIPSPETDGRLLVALDDYINPKIGKSIFGCETIFDHAPKPIKASIRGHKILLQSACSSKLKDAGPVCF